MSNFDNIISVVKDFLLVIGSLSASIFSGIGIYRVIKYRYKITWYPSSDPKGQINLRITNRTDKAIEVLGLFLEKDFILDKKHREMEKTVVEAIKDQISKISGTEKYYIIGKSKNIEETCTTDPKIQDKVLKKSLSLRFVIKGDLLDERIKRLFLRDSTGSEWDMPSKQLSEIKKYLCRDKIKLTAKIRNQKNKPYPHINVIVFKMKNNQPEIKRDARNDVIGFNYGESKTDKKGNLKIYISECSLKKDEQYCFGTGVKFAEKKKLFKKETFIFSCDDIKNNRLKAGRLILEKEEEKK